jgi:hypothetical protein
MEKSKIYLIFKTTTMKQTYLMAFCLIFPFAIQAQIEKIKPNTFRINTDVIHKDSASLAFKKGDTLYLNSDVRVFDIKQYEGAILYRACCFQLNAVGDNIIRDYYKTLERTDTMYQRQVDLNKKTTDLFDRFIDSTRSTTREASILLTATRKDLDSAKVDLTKALKEIKQAKWLLPTVAIAAVVVGVVIGVAIKRN